jgi:hypothetical protein
MKWIVALNASTVEVEATDRDDAIAKARAALGLEYPRLWDIIYAADDNKFSCEVKDG